MTAPDPVDARLLALVAEVGRVAVHDLARRAGLDVREVAARLAGLAASGLPLVVGVECDPVALRYAIATARPGVRDVHGWPHGSPTGPHPVAPYGPVEVGPPSGPQSVPSGPYPGVAGPHPGAIGPQTAAVRPNPGAGGPHPGASGPYAVPGGPHPGASGPHPGAGGGPRWPDQFGGGPGAPGATTGPSTVDPAVGQEPGHGGFGPTGQPPDASLDPVGVWGPPGSAAWARGDEGMRAAPAGPRTGTVGDTLHGQGTDGGQLAIRLVEVVDPADFLFTAAGYRLQPGERSVVVHTEVTNRGTAPLSALADLYLVLLDAEGHAVAKAPVALSSRPPHRLGVRPGETAGGHTVYVLPEATELTAVRWSARAEDDEHGSLTWTLRPA